MFGIDHSRLDRVSITVTKHHDLKASWEERVYLAYTYLHIVVHYQRKSRKELKNGQNLEAGDDAETIEECYLVACYS